MSTVKVRTPQEQEKYLEEQVREIQGDDNRYFAGEALGHEPTRSEAALHYVAHGGAVDFAKRWKGSHPDS